MLPKIEVETDAVRREDDRLRRPSDVVYGESPNHTDGRIASTAAVTTIGSTAQPILRVESPTALPSRGGRAVG